jgi:hypothetical protein
LRARIGKDMLFDIIYIMRTNIPGKDCMGMGRATLTVLRNYNARSAI